MQQIVIANWKMNPPRLNEAVRLFKNTSQASKKLKHTSVVIATPVSYLYALSKTLKGKGPAFAAQDIFTEVLGAFTGEESATMLKEVGAEYAIVGHSERRAMGENNELISRKVLAAHKAKLIPILCIGESQRDSLGEYLKTIGEQLESGLQYVTGPQVAKTIIAYEPVWAIGAEAKKEATARDIVEVNLYIRRVLTDRIGPNKANSVSILYGGSVSAENISEYVKEAGVNGFLVGRASLLASFTKILEAVDNAK
ncbi:MAG: triose-phosphate isomerase [bacterium]|nr:triose-phosphate isomerase [bacterium]